MAYILTTDLKRLIQSDNLNQIIGNDTEILSTAIAVAETEVKSYLVQKYIIADEFISYKDFANPGTFYPKDRILLTAPTYNTGTIYTTGMICLYNSNVYAALNATTGPFDSADWVLINPQYTKYYAIVPLTYTEFDYKKYYKVGDKVLYKGYKYTALQASQPLSNEQAIQFITYDNLPYLNVFPDDSERGVQAWGTGVLATYVDQVITNTAAFKVGDIRNQQLVNFCIDIALYHLHSRIAPRNIPELRVKRYDDAIEMLQQFAKGDKVTADLPKIQPASGMRVRYNSNVKQINSY